MKNREIFIIKKNITSSRKTKKVEYIYFVEEVNISDSFDNHKCYIIKSSDCLNALTEENTNIVKYLDTDKMNSSLSEILSEGRMSVYIILYTNNPFITESTSKKNWDYIKEMYLYRKDAMSINETLDAVIHEKPYQIFNGYLTSSLYGKGIQEEDWFYLFLKMNTPILKYKKRG